jgi:soluble lytic murein transglycosylase-like protein
LQRSFLGLLQFSGAQAREMGHKTEDMAALLDPETNLEIGIKLLKLSLLQASNRLDRALVLMYGHRGTPVAIRVFSKLKRYHEHLNSPQRPEQI